MPFRTYASDRLRGAWKTCSPSTGQELRDTQDGNSHSAVFQVIMEGQPRTLSPLLQDEIYRIAREVLRNAFQHACASRIEAAIHYDPNLFRLRIRDDGKGIDPAVLQEGTRAGHWGLPGIRERAKRIGARVETVEREWSRHGSGVDRPRLRRLRCVSYPPPIWALPDQNQDLMSRGPRT